MQMRTDKYSQMCHISALGLALYDTKLYLNTHPECREAAEYYETRKKEYDEAVFRYETTFGAITPAFHPECDIKWAWQLDCYK